MSAPLQPYDAIVLQSFGGPNGPDDVMPFLRRVVRGRDVPDERLELVAKHYWARGGVSPINEANRRLIADLIEQLSEKGCDLPVYFGNRNWDPYLVDTLREAYHRGARRIVSIVTSAYSSYSGCRQYHQDIDAALAALIEDGTITAGELVVDRIRPYFNHPGFIAANARALEQALAVAPHESTRVLFVTHSIPLSMNESSGPQGNAYLSQHRQVAEAVFQAATSRAAAAPSWDLVFCSRSGPPSQPWLEPDINDHLKALAEQGVSHVVVAPIGFVSDHMEVVQDLDTEAAQTAHDLGLHFVRAATVGTDPIFVAALVDLVAERASLARGEEFEPAVTTEFGALPVPCRAQCCPAPVRPTRSQPQADA